LDKGIAGKHPDEKSDDQSTDEQRYYHTLISLTNEKSQADMACLDEIVLDESDHVN